MKHQEFLLPPREEQAKLAELLFAIDESIERERELLNRIEINYLALSKKIFMNNNTVPINNYAEVISGSYGSDSGEFKVKVIGVSNIKDEGKIDFNKFNERFFTKNEFDKYVLNDGDLVMVKSSGSSTSILSGRTSMFFKQDEEFIISNFAFRIRPKSEINCFQLFHSINSSRTQSFLKRLATGSTYPNLGVSDIQLLKLYLPNENETNSLNNLYSNKDIIKKKLSSSLDLLKSLINQVF